MRYFWTTVQKTPATKTATGAVGTYKIRLEAVRELGSELGFGFLQPGSEGGALDADDLGDFLVSQWQYFSLFDLRQLHVVAWVSQQQSITDSLLQCSVQHRKQISDGLC